MKNLVFVGMDHGTTGISFAILSSEAKLIDVFKISREDSKAGRVKALDELSKRIKLGSIELMAITYAMGDGFDKILPIAPLPLIASCAKSYSKISFLSFGRGFRNTLTVSASPLGFAVNQSIELPSFP